MAQGRRVVRDYISRYAASEDDRCNWRGVESNERRAVELQRNPSLDALPCGAKMLVYIHKLPLLQ